METSKKRILSYSQNPLVYFQVVVYFGETPTRTYLVLGNRLLRGPPWTYAGPARNGLRLLKSFAQGNTCANRKIPDPYKRDIFGFRLYTWYSLGEVIIEVVDHILSRI